MLSHARVADYLKLTPEQQQALAQIISRRNAVRTPRGSGSRRRS